MIIKKQHLYLKFNLVFFLNNRVYSLFLVFYKAIEILKRDLYFYKIWTFIKSNLIQKDLFLQNFHNKYKIKFLNS